MLPSLTSAVYFFVFLGLCTWWSCCRVFDPLLFSCLCVLMAIFSAGHLIGLYLYQLQFFQEIIPPDDFYARWIFSFFINWIALFLLYCTWFLFFLKIILQAQLQWLYVLLDGSYYWVGTDIMACDKYRYPADTKFSG